MKPAPITSMLGVALAWGVMTGCRTPPRSEPPNWITLGNVRIDTVHREILVPGFINLDQGVIELLACGPQGKTHESVLVLTAEATHLQAAILLLGMKPGTGPTDLGVGQPVGPECDLWVEWTSAAGPRRSRAEHLIFNRASESSLPETGWVFNGSQIIDGAFMAHSDQSLIATFWEPWAILNLPLPCGADDSLLEVRTDTIPPKGTSIVLRLSPRS